jgi:GGDEF domain-containing protein
LRSSDTVARLGGDEFVILAGSANPDYAAQLAQKILEQLRLPILVATSRFQSPAASASPFFRTMVPTPSN